MNSTDDYLLALRRRTATGTVYAVAKLLDLPHLHVRAWYKGKSRPDAYSCVKIAEVLDVEPMRVIADVEAEREKDEVKKRRWRDLARKYGTSALVVLCTAIGAIGDSATAEQRSSSTPRGSGPFCIMSTALRRLLQRFCQRGCGRFPAFGS